MKEVDKSRDKLLDHEEFVNVMSEYLDNLRLRVHCSDIAGLRQAT